MKHELSLLANELTSAFVIINLFLNTKKSNLNVVIQTCQTVGLQHSPDIPIVPFKRLNSC